MPHLSCQDHKRRVIVVKSKVIHRNGEGDPCDSKMFSHGKIKLDKIVIHHTSVFQIKLHNTRIFQLFAEEADKAAQQLNKVAGALATLELKKETAV